MASGRRPKLAPHQIAQAIALREQGRTYPAIAALFGVSRGAIAWQCLRHGAEPPSHFRSQPPRAEPCRYNRAGKTVRRFSAAEDARIEWLEARGFSNTEIARDLGRRPNSIVGRLMTLARRDERAERDQVSGIGCQVSLPSPVRSMGESLPPTRSGGAGRAGKDASP